MEIKRHAAENTHRGGIVRPIKSSQILLLSLFALTAACPSLGALDNLVKNGGFETEELGMLSMWSTGAWVDTDDAVRFFMTEQAKHSGARGFAIANLKPNDSRGIQWVSVKTNTLYRLSAWVLAQKVATQGIGANISVLGSTSAAGDLKDTDGKWVYVELYGRTGPDQSSLAVLVRLGFYGSLATGVAVFDDVSLEEVASLPQGAKSISFGANEAAETFPVETSGEEGRPAEAQSASPGTAFWIVLLTLSALAAAVSIFNGLALATLVRSRKPAPSGAGSRAATPAGKTHSRKTKRRSPRKTKE
jgi:hypothetical protein